MAKHYSVIEMQIGQVSGDKLVFSSLADLDAAYKELDNGNDIYVEKDGIITRLKCKMLNTKVDAGTIVLAAKKSEVD